MKPEILKQLMNGEIKFDIKNSDINACESWLLKNLKFHLTDGSYCEDTNGDIIYEEESNLLRNKNGDLYKVLHYRRIDYDDPGCSMVSIKIYHKIGNGFLVKSNEWCRDFTKEEYDIYFGNEDEEN